MFTTEFYTDYFEDIATRLVDIGHAKSSPRFWMNMESNSHKELEQALRNKLEFPCLVLDEALIVSDGGAGPKITIKGGFAVLERYQNGSAIRELRSRTTNIVQKIVAKMKRDANFAFSENAPLAPFVQIGTISQYPTPIILNIATGWAVEFEWIMPENITYGMDDFSM